MADIPKKLKEGLALLYEHPEFKNLERWNQLKILEAAEQIVKVNMQEVRSETRVAFLQGQSYAHEYMLKEIKKIHKEIAKD